MEAIYRREVEARIMALAQAEANCRRAVQCAVRRYNEALAAEREQKEREAKRNEEEANVQEIINAINSDFLTENPAQGRSALGSHRVCPDRYKGFSPEQLAEIRTVQCNQIQEKAIKEEEEKKRNNLHDDLLIKASKKCLLIERDYERQLRERRRQIQEENMLLAEDQKSFQKYLNEEVIMRYIITYNLVVYKYQPTAAFFTQFNTTSR
ncbi:unnamed protein product [Hymenolepis diminuta]|uniref:Uncharacterized protein n=1 Tax=Hymenolepis diminuta TaxID=6216 RepID=A0A3P6ZIB0_HYMDI|nr:unnamed protein product [Hymenolepis diminuta]